MSEQDPIKVFVTHRFEEQADYLRVFEYLESVEKFFYRNLSNIENMPSGGTEIVKEELRNQIRDAEVVVLPVGVFEGNTDLMRFQMDVALAFKIPILAIQSFGSTMVMPKEILEDAVDVVDWNERAIVDGIRKHGRGEDTQRWEVVEFTLD